MDSVKHALYAASDLLTTAKATFLGLGFTVYSWLTQENVIWVLTVLVLLCQLVSWGHKFFKWCRLKLVKQAKAVE